MPPIRKPAPVVDDIEPLDPYWQTSDGATCRLYQGDVLSVLKRMPDRCVHVAITSPPYWALRDYQTAEWVGGGDPSCDHDQRRRERDPNSKQASNSGSP